MTSAMPETPLPQVLDDQRQRWRQGDRPTVETYLRQHPALQTDADALLDLIYNEVFLREQAGDRPRLEEYQQRFPHLAAELQVQFEVHRAIETGEAAPGLPTVPGYGLLGEVGRGGMSIVYKARQEVCGRVVALKMLRAEHFADRTVRQRFVAEARAVTRLAHPHLVTVYNVGECRAGPYLAMELIDGPSLEALLRRGPVEIAWAVRTLLPVAEAVEHAHRQGIIHRDLKPANIMLDATGRPVVLDFGLAKLLGAPATSALPSTQRGTILGTPAYMPPEQAGEEHAEPGPYSDVYSLGAILYALLTGRPPFDEDSVLHTLLKVRSPDPPPPPREFRPEVPPDLERFCLWCLSKRPAERPATARAVAEGLLHFAGQAGPAGPRPAVRLVNLTTGAEIELRADVTVLGRGRQCDIVLPALKVSRQHCRIRRRPDAVVIEDAGSRSGTYVNGRCVKSAELQDGDRIDLAGEQFTVRM
jgi:tRNA A-37 threonylcarbamoyl transferase component Bud32